MKDTDVRIVSAGIDFEDYDYRAPMKFGGNIVRKVTVLNAHVTVENRAGKKAEGFGSMTLGNVWSWPSKTLGYDGTLAAMKLHAEKICSQLHNLREYGHPVELMSGIENALVKSGEEASRELNIAEMMPVLCALVTISPFDAALHDAYGKMLGKNVYGCYSKEYMNADIGNYLDGRFTGEYLDRYTLCNPKETMPLYHLVGAVDPLTQADLTNPVNDGLPETLPEWIERDGLTHLKIKLNGDDLEWDVDRVINIERVASQTNSKLKASRWLYSLDFNEKCKNVEYLLDFLGKIKEKSPEALERIQYIEQPTSRDLRAGPENKMHKAAKIKPVVIDEALVDFESLLLSVELGYSGVALKACKGQTNALLMAAAAQKLGLFLCVQDLTCPGASFLHSAGIAARIPGVAAIEGNARQYLPPRAYRKWSEKYPEVFKVAGGSIKTGGLTKTGLGH